MRSIRSLGVGNCLFLCTLGWGIDLQERKKLQMPSVCVCVGGGGGGWWLKKKKNNSIFLVLLKKKNPFFKWSKRKTLWKAPPCRTLHKNTGRTSVSLYISRASQIRFHINFLIIQFKARRKKYFCPSYPENKIHSNTHHTHIPLNKDFNFD